MPAAAAASARALRRRQTADGYGAQAPQSGLVSPEDFVLHLPLRYEDETRVVPIASLRPGFSAQVEGEITKSEVLYRPRRQLTATLADDSGELQLRWLNFYPSQQKQVTVGKRLRARGEVRGGLLGREMVHPRMVNADAPLPTALTPVYPSTEGLPQLTLRRAIAQALDRADLSDTLPPVARERLRCRCSSPPSARCTRRRRASRSRRCWNGFTGMAAHQVRRAAGAATVVGRRRRAARRSRAAAAQRRAGRLVARLCETLPFKLTGAQQRRAGNRRGPAQPYPMHRLLQGDVGSGKTVVAAIAAAQAIAAGAQVALMAPTEILAEQHFRKLAAWLQPLGVNIAWMTGSLTAKARREAAAAVAEGSVQLVVGTQALIQDHVEFHRLGLSIVDEQHRFGVGQRRR